MHNTQTFNRHINTLTFNPATRLHILFAATQFFFKSSNIKLKLGFSSLVLPSISTVLTPLTTHIASSVHTPPQPHPICISLPTTFKQAETATSDVLIFPPMQCYGLAHNHDTSPSTNRLGTREEWDLPTYT